MSQQGHHRQSRPLDWDDGSASERTVLAWRRTAIASVAVAAVMLRAGIAGGSPGLAIPVAALLVIAAAGEWLFSQQVYEEHSRVSSRGAVVHGRAILVLVGVTLIVAAASAGLALGG